MLGALVGDTVGSRHEWVPIKTTEFEMGHGGCHHTDDSICTAAVAEALMTGRDMGEVLAEFTMAHVDAGYGIHFLTWAMGLKQEPYGSWGNGSAMRCSPAGWLSEDLAGAAKLGTLSAAPTHNHHEGVRGAKATSVAVRMALEGWSKDEIRNVVETKFGYDLSRSPDDIRPAYVFEISCQTTVPESLCCFLAAETFEETLRLCVSMGGDADTMCAIAGAVAEPFFGIAPDLIAWAMEKMPSDVRAVENRFRQRVDGKVYARTDPGKVYVDVAPSAILQPRSESLQREYDRVDAIRRISHAPARKSISRKLMSVLGFADR